MAGVRKVKPVTKTLHYIAVSELRAFESTEGKKILARLIAFEPGNPEGKAPQAPLTVIQEGKIRLLVEGKQKVSTLPLTRLKSSDQEFVKGLAKASAAAKAGTEASSRATDS